MHLQASTSLRYDSSLFQLVGGCGGRGCQCWNSEGLHRLQWHGTTGPRALNAVGNKVLFPHLGLSENSVPLKPMVLLIIIAMKNGYFIGNIPYFQTNPFLASFHVSFPTIVSFWQEVTKICSEPCVGRIPWRKAQSNWLGEKDKISHTAWKVAS